MRPRKERKYWISCNNFFRSYPENRDFEFFIAAEKQSNCTTIVLRQRESELL